MKPFRHIFAFALSLVLCTAALAGPTTLPATRPATQPAPLIPATKLQAVIATAPVDKPLVLPAGDYEVTDAIALRGNYDFRLAHFYKSTPPAGSNRAPQMFDVVGPDVRVLGGVYDSPYPASAPNGKNQKVNVYAFVVRSTGFVARDVTVRNIDTGFMLYAGQRHTRLINPHFTSEIRGDGVYCGGGDERVKRGELYIYKGRFDDSQQEHGLRLSTLGFVELVCVDCVFANHNHKEPFTVRVGNDVKCFHCTFDSDMGVYLGEGGGSPPPEWCGGLEFYNCDLVGGGYYNIRNGVQGVTIDGGSVEIRVDPAHPGSEPVCVTAYTATKDVLICNLTRRVVGGTTGKPFYRNWTGNPAAVVDGGGNVSVQAAQGK
jgi:hypothetical protein